MSLPISTAQLSTINAYGIAKNYPAMYSFIAVEMKAGRIAGASNDQTYWFEQAAKINAGDASSPASIFVRAATVSGLESSGSRTDAAGDGVRREMEGGRWGQRREMGSGLSI